MPSTKRLNGLPNSIGESYLSTLKYYHKGYMADWLNSVGLKTKEFDISIDIFNDKVRPTNCHIKPLIAWNDEFRSLIKKVLQKEGFELNFISQAIMKFQIRSRKGQNNIISCKVELTDIKGKTYSNKKPIKEEAYEDPFEPFSIIDKRRYS